MTRALIILCCLLAGPLQATPFYFCWQGDNGYSMLGQMTVRPAALNNPIVTEGDVTAFDITGFLDGNPIGAWDMATRDDDDSWLLRYDPARRAFLTPADLGLGVTQAWNADGSAMNCGNPGFGFNLGNFAQDFCLNGAWITQSGMPPDTPFIVSTTPVDPQCRAYTPIS